MNSHTTFSVLLLFLLLNVYRSTGNRIVGGHEVKIENYPWQASLVNVRGHFCGGAIMDRYRILTAAHCIHKRVDEEYEIFIRVRVGSSNRTSGGILCEVKKVIVHPEYQKPTLFDNDIAILILKKRLRYSLAVRSVSLPEIDSDLPVNSTVFVSGWGSTNEEDEVENPIILNAVSVPIVDRDVCYKAYKNLSITDELNARVTSNMICAGLHGVGGKDACQGDSGGPLVEIRSTTTILHGIVSWGYDCATPEYPGVYTRVSKYVEWIKKVR